MQKKRMQVGMRFQKSFDEVQVRSPSPLWGGIKGGGVGAGA